MNILRRSAQLATILLAATAVVASAGGYPHGTTRTYFGRPGTGPYGHPEGFIGHGATQNPWTGKCFGFRCCKTQEDCYLHNLKKASIAEARYQAMMNRTCNHSLWGNLSGGLCAGPCACAPGPECASGCGKCGFGWGCKGGSCHGHGGACHGGGCGHGGLGGHHGPQGPAGYGAGFGQGGNPLPGMNREDAVRYLEGMQYYPPHQLIRSPRDFFMFDVKYGIGR